MISAVLGIHIGFHDAARSMPSRLLFQTAAVAVLLVGSTAAGAQKPSATAGDPKAGAQIAAAGANGAAACAGCHGQRGEGMAAFPRLAGTGADYLRRQLDAFADGSRKNPIMQPIAQALSPQQRVQVAAYYASLPSTVKAADREARAPAEAGAWLATRGRWSDDLPACAQCHGPGGAGVGADFPPLAGLPAEYIAAQLRAWQADGRPPGPLNLMEIVARKLKEADIQAVSAYYAGLATPPQTTPAAAAASSTREAKK
jgi:cytochrome c553